MTGVTTAAKGYDIETDTSRVPIVGGVPIPVLVTCTAQAHIQCPYKDKKRNKKLMQTTTHITSPWNYMPTGIRSGSGSTFECIEVVGASVKEGVTPGSCIEEPTPIKLSVAMLNLVCLYISVSVAER